MALIGNREYFKGIKEIKYEGKDSKNPFAFKYYNPDKIVAGKTMRDHFKEPRISLGINLMTLYKLLKIKQMLHLNLFQKWDLIISVSMILI